MRRSPCLTVFVHQADQERVEVWERRQIDRCVAEEWDTGEIDTKEALQTSDGPVKFGLHIIRGKIAINRQIQVSEVWSVSFNASQHWQEVFGLYSSWPEYEGQ